MKRFISKSIVASFLFLSLFADGFGVAHAISMPAMHSDQTVSGEMPLPEMDVQGDDMHITDSACGLMDWLCYIRCQSAEVVSGVRISDRVSSSEKIASVCGLGEFYVGSSEEMSDTFGADFSPPDDPKRILTSMKRE